MTGHKADRKGRRPKATDPEEIAQILEYARIHDTAEAAEKYGVSVRTIRRWRSKVRSGDSPDVAALVTAQRKETYRRSADLICDTVDQLLRELQLRKEKLSNDELISAVEKVGQLRVQRDALNPHVEPAHADQPDEGAEAGGGTDPEREGGPSGGADEGREQVH